MTQTATAETLWCGWHRAGNGDWKKIVSDAASAAECWSKLLAAVASLRGGDMVVLESFRHPATPVRPFHAGGKRRL